MSVDEYNERKISAFKYLKKIGLFDKFKECLKKAPPKSTVTFSDDHVCILGEDGPRFLKKPQIYFDSDYPNGEFEPIPIVRAELIMKKAIKMRQSLEDEGYVLQPKQGGGLSLVDVGDKFVLSHFKKRVTTDDMLEMKLKYCEKTIIALSNDRTEDDKFNAIYELGVLEQEMSTLKEYGAAQSKIASQERKKGLNELFEKLGKRKAAGEKPKELWPEFISMLRERIETYDQVQEETTNPANPKTWKVSFLILADKDGDPQKEESMKFERFRKRLSNK